MENNVQGNNTGTQNTGSQNTAPRDWREMRRQDREERREMRHRWPFHGFFTGMVLVLLGVLFLLNETGAINGDTWWQALLIGLGVISIANGIARYFYPGYHWGSFGKIVCGIVLISVGIIFLLGVSSWWPIVLIVAGAAFLLRFFWRQVNVLP